jgi:hypothetical protein
MFRFTIRDMLWAMVAALGFVLLVTGGVAVLVGASVFTSARPVPPPWGAIGNLCFVSFWMPEVLGAALMFCGLSRLTSKYQAASPLP